MSDALTITDLETAKKHDTFHSEVITGKAGGLSTGANIDYATNQVTGQVQKTLPKVLRDLGMMVQTWTATTGGTLTDASQVFLNDITASAGKGNYYAWTGAFPKTVAPGTDPASVAGFVMRSDANLRAALASTDAYSVVAGDHRGTLQNDLDAIDRRPDGYGDSLTAVLATGRDLELNKDLVIGAALDMDDYQVFRGVGGSLTNNFKGAAIQATGKNGIKVYNARLIGIVENGPSVDNSGYAVKFSNSQNITIEGTDTQKYTGSVLLTNCDDCVVRDTYSRANRYHSDVAAGGYGVLLQGSRRVLVDGINFEADATKGDLGRHAFYVSVNPIDLTQFCEDIIVRGIISRKKDLKNRAMWDGVIRKSNNVLITDFNCRGSNGGFSAFSEQGLISNLKICNGTLEIVQYDNNAVYALGFDAFNGDMNNMVGIQVDNVEIIMSDDTSVVTTPRMVALSLLARNSRFSNIVIRTPGDSTPILVNGGMYLQFDNIHDFATRDGTGVVELIRFTAPTSGVVVKNVQTLRPMFAGLDFVTNMTVDYLRKVTVTNAAGTLTFSDRHGVVSSVAFSGANVVVTFKSHVTQQAVENALAEATSANTAFVVTTRAAKSMTFRVTDFAGAVKPTTSTYVLALNLFS